MPRSNIFRRSSGADQAEVRPAMLDETRSEYKMDATNVCPKKFAQGQLVYLISISRTEDFCLPHEFGAVIGPVKIKHVISCPQGIDGPATDAYNNFLGEIDVLDITREPDYRYIIELDIPGTEKPREVLFNDHLYTKYVYAYNTLIDRYNNWLRHMLSDLLSRCVNTRHYHERREAQTIPGTIRRSDREFLSEHAHNVHEGCISVPEDVHTSAAIPTPEIRVPYSTELGELQHTRTENFDLVETVANSI